MNFPDFGQIINCWWNFLAASRLKNLYQPTYGLEKNVDSSCRGHVPVFELYSPY